MERSLMMKKEKVRLLSAYLGNICRPPSAEAIMKRLVKDAGLGDRIGVDSAGTTGYHEGDRVDSRIWTHTACRGYMLDSISYSVRQWDSRNFGLVIGMDDQNVTDLKRTAPDLESVAKIHRMAEFFRDKLYDHVPDPYCSGAEGFELVLDLLEDACAGLSGYCKSHLSQVWGKAGSVKRLLRLSFSFFY